MKTLRLFPDDMRFPFMRFRRIAFPFSALLSVLTVVLFFTVSMNFGIDFTGGTLIEMRAKSGKLDIAKVRSAAEQVQAAQNTLDEQTLVLREKISNAWADWAMAQQRTSLNQDQAQAGQKLVESYRLQFRLARRSLLELLNVQNEAFGYASAALQMQYDQRLARFRLSAAMGELARAVKGEK